MRKSSLILMLVAAFVLATVAVSFSDSTIVDGPCKELCTKHWGYGLKIDSSYSCEMPTQDNPDLKGCPECPLFDYESALGYCGYNSGSGEDEDFYNAPGIVFKICDCPNPEKILIDREYGFRIEIVSPAKGVYFTSRNLSVLNDDPNGCGGTRCGDAGQEHSNGNWILASSVGTATNEATFCPDMCEDGTPYAFAYKPLDSASLFVPGRDDQDDGSECCLDCLDTLATRIQTTCYQKIMVENSPYVMIDIPTMVWDPKVIEDGVEVVVKVTLIGAPVGGGTPCDTCNDLCSCTVKIGEFGKCTQDACYMCFPYFSNGGDWWAGIALTNSGDYTTPVTIDFYAGGTKVSFQDSVAPHSVYVKALSQFDLSALEGKGAIYAEVKAAWTAEMGKWERYPPLRMNGFGIMGDGKQAYGYLSRYGMCGCFPGMGSWWGGPGPK